MRPMALLFVAMFNSILGLSVLFPILAPLGRELGLSYVEITSLSTSYALMQFLTGAWWGARSEAKGRKPVLLVGILGFAVTFFAFGLVADLGLRGVLSTPVVFVALMVTRVVGGAFSSATLPSAQAYAADVSERDARTRAMALIGMAFGLGVIFGPGIGAGLAALFDDLLAPVYFSASVAVLNAVFVWWGLPEPPRRHASRVAGPLAPIAKRVWPLLAVGFGATLASVAMEQTIAFYFQHRLGLESQGVATARVVGLALVGYGVVAVASQGLIVRRVRWRPIVLVRTGLPIAAAGLLLLVFAHDLASLTGALLVQGLGQGLVLPAVTAAMSLAVGDDDQGAVAGLHSSAQGLGRSIGPVLGGALYERQHEAPYVFGAALVAVVLVAVLIHRGVAPRPA